jgi:hypothetical protein
MLYEKSKRSQMSQGAGKEKYESEDILRDCLLFGDCEDEEF